MIFQALDSKAECMGIYSESKLHLDNIPWNSLSCTWRYSPSLRSCEKLKYAYIISGGASLREACPLELRDAWDSIEIKMKAFIRAFALAKLSMEEHCFYDLMPLEFLCDYFEIRNLITEHVLKNYELPLNYNFLSSVHEMLEDIGSHNLIIKPEALKANFHQIKTRNFYKKLIKLKPRVRYNLFGSKTGRLTTVKNTFPILTLDSTHRAILEPENDLFIELDYNGAEIRTLLSLSGKCQPVQDIHEWNLNNCARNLTTRKEMKERFFAWLYNPNSKDTMIERYYDKEIAGDYWDGQTVTTPYGRVIESDRHHSLNYLIQSTTNDIVLENAIKIHEFLKEKKSRIAFTVHDSIVLDYSETDRGILFEIIKMFEETRFGNFYANVRGGKNYGVLREIKWKL